MPKYFSPKTTQYLKDLKANNNKAWFLEHKEDYNQYLLDPFRQLVSDLSSSVLKIDPSIETRPAVNKTISRIYRDSRFSKDKTPYKTTMWLTFKRPSENWQDAPAYFFEISPDSYRYGMGYFCATPKTMTKFREVIDADEKKFTKLISVLDKQKIFELKGDEYKRIFDSTKSAQIQEWYQKKSFYLVCNRKIDKKLYSEKLVDDLKNGFEMLVDLYRFLYDLKK